MNQSGRPLTFAVLGGAGAMGRIAVRDLIATTPLGTEVLMRKVGARSNRYALLAINV